MSAPPAGEYVYRFDFRGYAPGLEALKKDMRESALSMTLTSGFMCYLGFQLIALNIPSASILGGGLVLSSVCISLIIVSQPNVFRERVINVIYDRCNPATLFRILIIDGLYQKLREDQTAWEFLAGAGREVRAAANIIVSPFKAASGLVRWAFGSTPALPQPDFGGEEDS